MTAIAPRATNTGHRSAGPTESPGSTGAAVPTMPIDPADTRSTAITASTAGAAGKSRLASHTGVITNSTSATGTALPANAGFTDHTTATTGSR